MHIWLEGTKKSYLLKKTENKKEKTE